MQIQRIDSHMVGVVIDPKSLQPFLRKSDVILTLVVVQQLVLVESHLDVLWKDVCCIGDIRDRYGLGSVFQNPQDSLKPPSEVSSLTKIGQRSLGGPHFLRDFAELVGELDDERSKSPSLVTREGHDTGEISVGALFFFREVPNESESERFVVGACHPFTDDVEVEI